MGDVVEEEEGRGGRVDRSNSSSSNDEPKVEKKLKIEEVTTTMSMSTSQEENVVTVTPEGEQGQGQGPSTSKSNGAKNGDGGGVMEEKVKQEDFGQLVDLKVIFNKKPLNISMPLKKTVGDLKLLIETETKVAPALQKVLLKGIPKDDQTLESLGVNKQTKIMVIGTALSDVMEVAKPPDKESLVQEETKSKDNSNWSSLPQHRKVLDKGVPEDVMPGILNESEPLPDIPLFGMLNSKGGKVRLTFKLELDELWIGTKERTDKIPIGSIRNVESQPITGYEHYHVMAIQLGPTEASRYFVYWVPSQYVDAIKTALGI